MIVGGSTTSLLSILNTIDYTQYNVDLLLYNNNGLLQKNIPEKVTILESADISIIQKIFFRVLSLTYIFDFIKSRILSKTHATVHIKAQIMSKHLAKHSRKITKQYDAAISFLEFWPCEYVANYVNATKKIAWLHTDYKAIGAIPQLDIQSFNKIDTIVTVSEECLNNFIQLFPMYEAKTVCINNILSQPTINKIADSEICEYEIAGSLKIVTVCRLVFSPKGLDRGVKVFKKLKDEGLLNEDIKWYIIGDGVDRINLESMIKLLDLEDHIILLGLQENPYKFLKVMDVFFLPSLYEGKPMAVTESQMLGVIPFITNYASASEQVKNGYDGIIIENNDVAIYEGLKKLIQGKFDLALFKKHLNSTDYSNDETINLIYNLIK